MERTKNRVLVRGLISGKVAIVYAIILGILGLAVLYCLANPLTAIIAVIGLFFYVIAYSLYFKRNSIYGTVIGAISGAIPPVVGYTAVTNRFDVGAVILFMILFFWQMPHFYAISICRLNDYSAASIPILPIKKDLRHTKISMLVYMVAFTIASILPSVVGLTGKIYFIAALAMGLIWLGIGLKGFKVDNEIQWARKVFMFSIINITLLSILMIVRV
jgi:protoheme IX farnesyltransferase